MKLCWSYSIFGFSFNLEVLVESCCKGEQAYRNAELKILFCDFFVFFGFSLALNPTDLQVGLMIVFYLKAAMYEIAEFAHTIISNSIWTIAMDLV